jgi:predicted RNA-binding protein YlqC (UPF0109 family)
MSTIDQQFVEFIVKSLVSDPDAVQVERRIDEKGVLLELTVDPEDLGRVIGKRGATAQSIRTLLRALGTKNDARYNLKIVDNGFPGGHGGGGSSHGDDHGYSDHSDDHARSDDNPSSDDDHSDSDHEEVKAEENDRGDEHTSNVVSKTRQELDELDDLDV